MKNLCLYFPHQPQADNEFGSDHQGNKYGYVTYFIVLVVWEVIPTYLIVIFFRVRMPLQTDVSNIVGEGVLYCVREIGVLCVLR